MKQEDLIYQVAKETGFSKETIAKVIEYFWSSIRYYITHPLESKMGIRLRYFAVLELRTYRIERYLKSRKDKDYNKGKIFEPYETLLKRLINEREEEETNAVDE